MEQNREPRNRPTQIQTIDLQQMSKGSTMEHISFQQMVQEQVDIYVPKKKKKESDLYIKPN